MKKIIPITLMVIILLSFNSTYAITSSFNFNSSNLSFNKNSKKSNVTNKFNKQYNLTKKIDASDAEVDKLKQITKKTTVLLLGEMNSDETNETYYQRHQAYLDMGLYNAFPKDSNTKSGYDETNPNYPLATISELAIPQIFNKANELEVKYSKFGEIKVIQGNDLAICTITLPDVIIKEENKENPLEYERVETNLNFTYYFVKVKNDYFLGYLYGETTDDIENYLEEAETLEGTKGLSILSSYGNDLKEIYDYSKVDNISDSELTAISDKNKNNILTLDGFYNESIVTTANGFLISDGLVVTSWSFLENALINAQIIIISNAENDYLMDGIVTANPETDVAVIKLKEKAESTITLADNKNLNIEDAALALTSKTGNGITLQKGIVVSKDGYIQSAIPLSKNEQGSMLLDKDGNVIGMNINKSTSSNISYAVGSDILSEIKEKIENTEFEDIETVTFEDLKSEFYYTKYNDEKITNTIPTKQWEEISEIGKLNENIKLSLVKANCEDGIISLRYENPKQSFMTSMQYAGRFKNKLKDEGYKEKLNQSDKCIYENDQYQIIIMQEFNYLIIVIVRL